MNLYGNCEECGYQTDLYWNGRVRKFLCALCNSFK